MKEKTEKAPTVQAIDWEKFTATPGHQYVINMMVALNDSLSLFYLLNLIDQDRIQREILISAQNGASCFLLRCNGGQMFAAHEYFVGNANPSKGLGKFLKSIHLRHASLNDLYDEYKTLGKDPKFSWIRDLRHNFAYHLNFKRDGERTSKAFRERLCELKEAGSITSPLMGIQYGNSPLEIRYLIADEIVLKGFRQTYGNAPEVFENYDNSEQKNFLQKIGVCFIAWARGFINEYLKDNALLLGEPQLLSDVVSKQNSQTVDN